LKVTEKTVRFQSNGTVRVIRMSEYTLIIATLQKWDTLLCQQDSDGDGKTNGQELGDPACKWSPGKPVVYIIGLSHPGNLHMSLLENLKPTIMGFPIQLTKPCKLTKAVIA
jgi:hypothetical protein